MRDKLDPIIQALVDFRAQLPASLEGPGEVYPASEVLPLLVWSSDLEGRLLSLDGPCEDWFGLASSLLLGRAVCSLWNSGELESVAIWQSKVVTLGGEGAQQRWLQLDSQMTHDPQGNPTGFCGTMLDVSDWQRSLLVQEQQCDHLRHSLQEQEALVRSYRRQMRLQEALMLGFGRDMRTLMHRLLGLLSMLRQKPLDRQQDDCADGIHSSLEHLLHLAQPLEQALGNGFNPRQVQADFDLRQAVAEVCRWMSAEVSSKGLQLQISVAPSIPNRVRGDGVKLRQILMQLVDNAIKFTTQGKVMVEASGQKEVRFCVRDSGSGIPSDKLEALFEGSLFDGDLDSPGLGLRLARHLVDQMGGKIWADSVAGKGTSIYFTIAFEEESGLPPDEVPLRKDPGGSLQILLAEDDPISQKVTLRSLRKLGHKVDIVSSGLQVLEALKRATYDVVLLDVEMPEMDGLETARQIKRRFVPSPYLIALTAGTSAQDRRQVMLSGMNDYLAKPLRQDELVDALGRSRAPQ